MEPTIKEARIVRHKTAARFLAACADWLSEHEDIHNGVLSLAHALGSGKHIHTPPFIFAHVESGSQITGCAIYAEPDGITLSEMRVGIASLLFENFLSDISRPSRIHGPRESANELANRYAKMISATPVLRSEWNIYRLDDPPHPRRTADGSVRLATKSDTDMVREWGKSYDAEKPANVNIEKFFSRKLEDGLLFIWIDSQPKALLTLSGINCSGNRISSVFTPEQYRGNGYATALVHEMSTRLLAAGKAFITLNTEIGDPAEHIYEALGYYTIGNRVSFVFDPAKSS